MLKIPNFDKLFQEELKLEAEKKAEAQSKERPSIKLPRRSDKTVKPQRKRSSVIRKGLIYDVWNDVLSAQN